MSGSGGGASADPGSDSSGKQSQVPKIEIEQTIIIETNDKGDDDGDVIGLVIKNKDQTTVEDLGLGGLSVKSDGSSGSGGSGKDSGLTGSSSGSSPIIQIQKKSPQDFIFGKVIGEGSFSSVYLSKDVKIGKEYAIKVCDKQHIIREKKTESIKREKDVMTVLSSKRSDTAPFFVHLFATFQDASRLYFVMTLAEGGELLKYLNRESCFSKKTSQFYGGEIIQALKHLHTLKICHRDLKPENILLNEFGHILITDFGSAKIIISSPAATEKSEKIESVKSTPGGRTRSNSFVGTAQYVSPEILQGRYSEVGPAVDLWAFGCIIYQFLTGQLLFKAPSEFLTFRKILDLDYTYPENFDEDAKDLITKLLKLQYTERLGAKDKIMYTSIESHPFFNGINFETLHEQPTPIMTADNTAKLSPVKRLYQIPVDYEPGFNPRVIAERFLQSESEENLPYEDSRASSDESAEENSKSQPIILPTTETETDLKGLGEPINHNPNLSDSLGATPPRRLSKGKITFPSDDQERLLRLEEQARGNPWHKVVKGNLIIKQGMINKRKGLFCRRRMLLLTEGPHLFYCDSNSMTVKGEIMWSSSIRPEAKDFKVFHIHTPNRTYYLEDPEGFALSWCDAINGMIQHS